MRLVTVGVLEWGRCCVICVVSTPHPRGELYAAPFSLRATRSRHAHPRCARARRRSGQVYESIGMPSRRGPRSKRVFCCSIPIQLAQGRKSRKLAKRAPRGRSGRRIGRLFCRPRTSHAAGPLRTRCGRETFVRLKHFPAAPKCMDRLPAADASNQATADELRPGLPGIRGAHESRIKRSSGFGLASKALQYGSCRLPRTRDRTRESRVAGVWVRCQLAQARN